MSARRLLAAAIAALGLLGPGAGAAVAGATFPRPVCARWAALSAAERAHRVWGATAGTPPHTTAHRTVVVR